MSPPPPAHALTTLDVQAAGACKGIQTGCWLRRNGTKLERVCDGIRCLPNMPLDSLVLKSRPVEWFCTKASCGAFGECLDRTQPGVKASCPFANGERGARKCAVVGFYNLSVAEESGCMCSSSYVGNYCSSKGGFGMLGIGCVFIGIAMMNFARSMSGAAYAGTWQDPRFELTRIKGILGSPAGFFSALEHVVIYLQLAGPAFNSSSHWPTDAGKKSDLLWFLHVFACNFEEMGWLERSTVNYMLQFGIAVSIVSVSVWVFYDHSEAHELKHFFAHLLSLSLVPATRVIAAPLFGCTYFEEVGKARMDSNPELQCFEDETWWLLAAASLLGFYVLFLATAMLVSLRSRFQRPQNHFHNWICMFDQKRNFLTLPCPSYPTSTPFAIFFVGLQLTTTVVDVSVGARHPKLNMVTRATCSLCARPLHTLCACADIPLPSATGTDVAGAAHQHRLPDLEDAVHARLLQPAAHLRLALRADLHRHLLAGRRRRQRERHRRAHVLCGREPGAIRLLADLGGAARVAPRGESGQRRPGHRARLHALLPAGVQQGERAVHRPHLPVGGEIRRQGCWQVRRDGRRFGYGQRRGRGELRALNLEVFLSACFYWPGSALCI